MGKLNIFEITLSNFYGVYYSGQNVQGHCTVELTEEMDMRGIRVKFEGKAFVHWTEQHTYGGGKGSVTVTRYYSATEDYFSHEALLLGKLPSQGSQTLKLPAGRHTFPFTFLLPEGLPSSFEDKIGHVRYSVKAIIDKPWKFDHTTKRPFTVIGVLDLNREPDNALPVDGSNEKMLCCLCCATGPISATFRLERRGYVPGEAVRLFADIVNKSNRKMKQSYIDLRMVKTFHATSKSRTTCSEVGRVSEVPIEPYKSFSWETQQFVLPPLPPTGLAGCKIIDVRYILQLNVDPSGPSLDLEVPLEIVIGNVPLRQIFDLYPPLPYVPSYPSKQPSAPLPPEVAMPLMPQNSIPNLPPPSYSESVFGTMNVKDDEDNEHTRGNLDFAPVYSYYNWGHTPTPLTLIQEENQPGSRSPLRSYPRTSKDEKSTVTNEEKSQQKNPKTTT